MNDDGTSAKDAVGDVQKSVDPVMKGCGLGCLGLVALFAAMTLWFTFFPSDDDGAGDQYEAVSQCEGFTDKRLKAPATADYDLEAVNTSGSSWTVTGTVDSENSFGAKVRSDVRCEITLLSDRARLDDISIDQR